MTKWLKELKPNRVEDLMIMIAIFRPGPMANIPEFIARKNGKHTVSYFHPKMSKFLDKSYGILVYQDDVLFTALEMAGYDWGSVDKFRKAIGKKIPEEMAKQHEIFVSGCMEHSQMTKDEAEKLWDLFVPFQGYGFNKAHAASYGIVSYQTAYLKANYPVEYMTALLTAEAGNTEKIVEGIDECKRMKIKVLAPDINTSHTGFTIEPDTTSLDGRAIRFGLSAIKNVGQVAIDIILAARADGLFKSFTDFCLRVDSQKVNRKVLESLIKAGAMDRFGKRAQLLAALDKIRDLGTSISKLKNAGQTSLFATDTELEADHSDTLPDIAEFEKNQLLTLEKELLGFYLSEHPHQDKLAQLVNLTTHRISELDGEQLNGHRVTVGGVIVSCRNVMTKANNQPMCFITLSDLNKTVDVVVFPKTYAATPGLWQVDNIVLLSGKAESRETETNAEDVENGFQITILADSAVQFTGPDTVLPTPPSSNGTSNYTKPLPIVEITIPQGTPSAKLVQLNELLQSHQGRQPANLVFLTSSQARIIPLPFGLHWTDELKKQVFDLLKA
jgi:DNA polymerase-3 subunit alpha